MKQDVAEEICEVVGVVDRSPKDSEVESRSFLRIRVFVDVSLPLCRGHIISMEDGIENWVTFKYERLPNICYWCGCLNHVDKDCDHWIESDGTLTKDDQEYGPWICAGPTAMFRNSVVKVPGFYEVRKKKAPEEKQDSGGVFPTPERSRGIQRLSGQIFNMESTKIRGGNKCKAGFKKFNRNDINVKFVMCQSCK